MVKENKAKREERRLRRECVGGVMGEDVVERERERVRVRGFL